MNKETNGIVVSVSRQWWLKINTKAVRLHAVDGATFPHIIKVRYIVDGREYTKRKWIRAGAELPAVGNRVRLIYSEDKPTSADIIKYT